VILLEPIGRPTQQGSEPGPGARALVGAPELLVQPPLFAPDEQFFVTLTDPEVDRRKVV
jgi:hypothetical protein